MSWLYTDIKDCLIVILYLIALNYWNTFVVFLLAGVARLKVLHKEKKKALNDNVIEVTNLCEVIEGILRHQQKGLYMMTSRDGQYVLI